MNRKELAKALAVETSLSPEKAERLVTGFCNVVEKVLAEKKKIVYSNFGTFYTVHYPSKVIYHPKLGKAKQMVMLPTDAIKWMPSGNIKDLVNSEKEVEGIGPLIAHGVRKITQGLNKAPKSFTYAKDQEQIYSEKSQNITAPADPSPAPDAVSNIADEISEDEEVVIPIRNIKKKTTPEPVITTPEEPTEKIIPETTKLDEVIETPKKEEAISEKKMGLFGRLFNRENAIDEVSKKKPVEASKVSLKGAGIFSGDIPLPSEDQAKKPASEVENIPVKTATKEAVQDFAQPASPVKAAPPKSDGLIEITPFPGKGAEEQVSYIDLSKTIVSKDLLQKISEKVARQYKVVPISETDKDLTIAMVDPQDLEAREIIKKMIQKPLVIRLSSEEDINHILDQYSGLEKELSEAIKNADIKENDQEKTELIESAGDNAPAARIVTSLLRRAIRDKASDIHIEPEEKDVMVRFRQDGILRKTVALPKDIQSSVVSRIKIMANMKIDEQRLPQDGRFSITVDNRKVDFRVSTMPVANGEKVVMRVLDKLTGILTTEQLGIVGSGLKSLEENLKKSHGMILVTGPTGSGKTTTLYALIDKLYSEGVNIITLEDPIEYRMPGINQSQVNAEIDYTFASGLRSIVRQDPDIIMIGEIRDSETAEMAVHAALTGHIVLSTLHTNDSAGAAPRLLDMGVEPFLLTSSLNAVIAQRLARKICEDCKEELEVSPVELEKIKAEIARMPEGEKPKATEFKFFHGKGCKNCNNTGYKSRIGLYEILNITEPLKELILKKESSSKIQEMAIQNGMVTMLGDGILKALNGLTTLEEVWRITEE